MALFALAYYWSILMTGSRLQKLEMNALKALEPLMQLSGFIHSDWLIEIEVNAYISQG